MEEGQEREEEAAESLAGLRRAPPNILLIISKEITNRRNVICEPAGE